MFKNTKTRARDGAHLNPKQRWAPSLALRSGGFGKTKKVITIAVLLAVVATSVAVWPSLTQASWFGAGKTGSWNYRQKITIDHRKVPDTDNSKGEVNFPVEISVPANALTKSMNNGGHVGLDTGYDIVFTSGDGKTKLNHEIESYASTTGAIIAWVKIPSLSSKTDTTLYMYYGNSSATDQSNKTAVWDSNYKGVWHLGNGTTLSASDSIGVNNGSISNATVGTGQIDGDAVFNGTSAGINVGNSTTLNFGTGDFTVSGWFKSSNSGTQMILGKNVSGAQQWQFQIDSGQLIFYDAVGGASCAVNYTSNNVWQYAVYTRTGTFGTMYVNGTLLNCSGSFDNSNYNTQSNLFIGQREWGGYENWFNGQLDELRVSAGIARTADWIKTEYNNQSSPSTFETFGAEETQPSAQINGGWYNVAWSYRKKITIPHSQVSGTSTLSNFPVLISTTQQILSYTSFGGHVASSTGGDILFTTSDGKTPLNYEIESYASTTGSVIAWVQIPSLSPTADNTIYMYYGNASAPAVPATTAQNVWSNGYAGVWHLPNGTSLSANDSTFNNNVGTPLTGVTATTTGVIDGAAAFASTAYGISVSSSASLAVTSFTAESWWKPTTIGTYAGPINNRVASQAGFQEVGDNNSGTTHIPHLVIWNGTSETAQFKASTYTLAIPVSSPVHYVWTYDGSTAILYINGVAQTVTTSAVTGFASAGTMLGKSYNGLTGMADEFRISTVARSASWIATEYANQSAPSTFHTIAGEETQAITTFNSSWYSSAWGYRKPLVIDHRKVIDTDGSHGEVNFPVLISITDPDLKNYASSTGADILFTSSDGKTKLNHEIESYNSTTGQLIAWVQIPSLVSTTDTTIYMYFGNASATSQQNATAVWDSNYKGVWHLNEANGATALDSSSNGYNLTSASYPTATSNGKIGSAQNFGQFNVLTNGSLGNVPEPSTISGWINASQFVNGYGNLAGYSGYEFAGTFNNSGNITAAMGGNSRLSGVTSLSTNQWYYIVGVNDLSGNSKHIYVNGQLDDSVHVNGEGGNSYIPWKIGGNAGGQFIGDEIRVSDSVRTADWIKTEYLNQSSPSTFYAKGALQTQNHTAQQSNEQISNRGWYNGKGCPFFLKGASFSASCSVGSWSYRMPITISHNMVGSSTTATLQNFPVLVSVTNANLKSVSNGGGVASTSAADIVFTDGDGGTKLAHEIESYDAVNGILIAWVKVPILSTTIDHTIYIYYGNSAANLPSQANPTAVWDSNYKGVWHLPNGTTLSANDSTSNANNGTLAGSPLPAAVAGQIDGAAQFTPNNSNKITATNNFNFSNSITVSAWIKPTSLSNIENIVGNLTRGNGNGWALNLAGGPPNNKVNVSTRIAGTWHEFNTNTQVTLANNNLYFVTFTYDGTNIVIYVNGGNSQSFNYVGTINNGETALSIGATPTGGATDYYTGNIDEVRVSNKARSADWIATEYLNQSAPGSYVTLGAQQTSGTAVQTSNWYNSSWSNRRTITIDRRKISQVSGTDLVNFPMLFSTTDNEFKMPSGKVKENHGYDFVFTDSDGKTVLNSEIESYASSTGQLIAWVKIPNLSSSQDHTIYLYYGNASASAPSSTFTQGVWDSGYKGVWHMSDAASPALDSTSNGNSAATAHGSPTFGATGNISKGISFSGSTQDLATAAVVTNVTDNFTMSAWINPRASFSYPIYNGSSAANNGWGIYINSTQWRFHSQGGFAYDFGSLKLSNWQMITVVRRSGQSFGYINGVEYSLGASAPGTPTVSTNIGSLGGSGYFNGTLDEARISITPRTYDWIKTEYLNQSNPSKFYAISPSNQQQNRNANTPLLKSRGGVQMH